MDGINIEKNNSLKVLKINGEKNKGIDAANEEIKGRNVLNVPDNINEPEKKNVRINEPERAVPARNIEVIDDDEPYATRSSKKLATEYHKEVATRRAYAQTERDRLREKAKVTRDAVSGEVEDKTSAQKKKDKKLIKEYEKRTGDYGTFGIAFDLKSVDINSGDSSYMKSIKEALSAYLKIRRDLFERHSFDEQTAADIFHGINAYKPGKSGELINREERQGKINESERENLGKVYDALMARIDKYTFERGTLFMTKRRRVRLAQIKAIKDQLKLDNIRFQLSSVRRGLINSLDNDHRIQSGNDMETWDRTGLLPTWKNFVALNDNIYIRNRFIDEIRQYQREQGTLDPLGIRFQKNVARYMKIAALRVLQGYQLTGGLADRTVGAATMLAANTLELAGKAIKLPIKILSSVFNFGSKYLAGSKKRWRVDYSLTKGWKDLEAGRRIFRRYLKGACAIPAAVVETVTRGIPYLFAGHKFKSGVYKRTSKWSEGVREDIKNVFRSIGIDSKYDVDLRAQADMDMAGGYMDLEKDEANFKEGSVVDPESLNAHEGEVDKDKFFDLSQEEIAAANTEVEKNREIVEKETNDQTVIRTARMQLAVGLMKLLVNRKKKDDRLKAAKDDVVKLYNTLESIKNVRATKDAVDEVAAEYSLTIKSLMDYWSHGKKNTEEKELARQLWMSLSYEKDVLNTLKDGLDQDDDAVSMGQLLHYSENNIIAGEWTEMVHHEQKGNVSADAAFAINVLKGNYDFTAAFTGPKVDRKTKAKAITNLIKMKDTLKDLQSGGTGVVDVEMYGRKVRLLQKEDKSLYIIEDHARIPVEASAKLLVQRIENNMMDNPDNYSNTDLKNIIRDYANEERRLTSGEHLMIRSNLVNFLVKKLGMKREDFNDISRLDMARYAYELVDGSKTVKAVKDMINNSIKSEQMINGVELTELMTIDADRMQELEKNVSMYKTEVIAEQNDFTAEEKEVQNFLAEFIYSQDTMIMDKYANKPEEFVRTILLQNIPALAKLVRDSRDDNKDIIGELFKKMSLDKIFGDNKESLCNVISDNINTLCHHLSQGKCRDAASLEDIESKLEQILKNKKDKDFSGLLSSMHNSMNASVSKACAMLQRDVSEFADNVFAESQKDSRENLESIMKNTARSKKGQGKFIRKVFDNYFKQMPVLDQRAMLASVLRGARHIQERQYSNNELIKEIEERNLKEYSSLMGKSEAELSKEYKEYLEYQPAQLKNRLNAQDKDKLTEQDKQLLDKYRKEKIRTAVGANYLAGLIRGAGPLFQKMMQGLPEETLPVEIRLALRDVKSKLPPIPERVVKTQINAMIERSGGTVKKIDVVKNLGAASVGQTFLCRMYGPKLPAEGKQVVIKLLRPDVQNRMKREEKIMLKCAKDTDPGMEATYKGQLENYYKELDLTNECENISKGAVYNTEKHKDVRSEEVNNLIAPTVNSLVLELADGKNLDDILLETESLRQRLREEVNGKVKNPDGSERVRSDIPFSHEKFAKTLQTKKLLIKKANELIKKRDIMADLTETWLTEAIFGGGYYHADLHAGNIMISDDKGTLIDYGNASVFNKEQQAAITKMMTSAADGDVDLFFDSFNSLLDMKDQEFAAFYNDAKKREVKAAFAKVLKMGEDDQTGERISVALIKAQELGIKLPSSIYNFSQGQLRLQKSINDINDMIDKIKSDIAGLDTFGDRHNKVDMISSVMSDISQREARRISDDDYDFGELDRGAIFKSAIDKFDHVDKNEFIAELLDNTHIKGKKSKGIAEVDKRSDFNKKYLDGILDAEKQLTEEIYIKGKEGLQKVMPDFKGFRKIWEDYYKEWISKKGTAEQLEAAHAVFGKLVPTNVSDDIYKQFGGSSFFYAGLMDALEKMDAAEVEERLTVYEKDIPRVLKLERKIKELRSLQDRNELSEEKKQKLTEEIYKLYNERHAGLAAKNDATQELLMRLDLKDQQKVTKFHLQGLFDEETTTKVKVVVKEGDKEIEKEVDKKLGELFREKVEEYITYTEPYITENNGLSDDIPAEIKKKIKEKRKDIADYHIRISQIQLKRFCKDRFNEKVDIKSYDFGRVMQNVIRNNWAKYIGNVGMGYIVSRIGGNFLEAAKNLNSFLKDDLPE